jgi:uncharacterized membrane protein YbaN (DUF454 family)
MVQHGPGARRRSRPLVSYSRGAIVIEHPELFSEGAEEMCLRFLHRALNVKEVAAIEVDRSGSATVHLAPGVERVGDVLRAVAAALRNPDPTNEGGTARRFHFPLGERFVAVRLGDLMSEPPTGTDPAGADDPPGPAADPAGGRIARTVYGALALGSFGMAWVGLVTPGIPTVPFVLLTSYFAVRSSPALLARLKRSRVFGPMLADWQKHGAIRRRTKWIAVGSALALTALTLILVAGDPVMLGVGAALGLAGVALLLRLPTVETQSADAPPG